MKKLFFSFSVMFTCCFLIATAHPVGPCPSCDNTDPQMKCTGICIGIYGEDGKISYYECKAPDPGSSATKDCRQSSSAM